jgi:electron transport complex protein RnfE
MKNNFYFNHLKEGLITNTPITVQLVGMCPTLAVSGDVASAFGMGISAMVVLSLSNLIISLLRKFIPKEVRIAAYIVIISAFVGAVDMVLQAYMYDTLYKSLGIFIPLIVVNCIILARAEAFASKNTPLRSLWDGITMGLGFTFALVILGTLREIFGKGTFLGMPVFGETFAPIEIFTRPAGAFITLGCVIAAMNAILAYVKRRKKNV